MKSSFFNVSKSERIFYANELFFLVETRLFGGRAIPVPREDFELLKHHFPTNWWREEKPADCLE